MEECEKALAKSKDICKDLVEFVQLKAGAEAKNVEGYELRSGIADDFVSVTLGADEFVGSEEVTEFQQTMQKVVVGIKKMIDCAEAQSRQETLLKNSRHLIDSFIKTHRKQATKQDLSRLLLTLIDHAMLSGDSAGLARGNLVTLQQLLHEEVSAASHAINCSAWIKRLEHFRATPFKVPKNGGWKNLK